MKPELGPELALELELVKTEAEEREERLERDSFWIWNTTDADIDRVKPGKGALS